MTNTALISLLTSALMRSARAAGSAAAPQTNSNFSTCAPKRWAIWAKRSPKEPMDTTSTRSPGDTKLLTAASMAPLPAPVRMSTSCLVRKTSFRPSVASANKLLNSGPRWLIIGLAKACSTSCGTGVGPGSIRSCFSFMAVSSLTRFLRSTQTTLD